MNSNIKTLKKQSEENITECMEMLCFRRLQDKSAVIIDATLDDDDKVCYNVYTMPGEKLLKQLAEKAVMNSPEAQAFLNNGGTITHHAIIERKGRSKRRRVF